MALTACSHQPPSTSASASGETSTPAPSKAALQVGEAATAPLNDLNLVRAEIPPILRQAQKTPYAVPEPLSCSAVATEVQALDAVLGPDLDTPPTDSNPSLIERGGDAAGQAVVGALRNTTEGLIPFRGWVRKLTGAERYSRQVAAAITAGTVRRGFLKGLGQAQRCEAPAAPRT